MYIHIDTDVFFMLITYKWTHFFKVASTIEILLYIEINT